MTSTSTRQTLELFSQVLRDILGVHCFLGLTATSTKATSISITKHLGIDETESENAIIRGPTMPDNLHITVSKDDDRDQVSCRLLKMFFRTASPGETQQTFSLHIHSQADNRNSDHVLLKTDSPERFESLQDSFST